MESNTRCGVTLLLLMLVTLCACSPQKSLASRLANADRVVVTNPGDGVNITISDEQLKDIVQAVEVSQKIGAKGLEAVPGYRLDFFKGTNYLATVTTSDLIFWIDKTPYHDKSGTLRAVYERFWKMNPPLSRPL